MKSPRRRPTRWVPLLIALTCIGCSEEEPAVKIVISGHAHTYAETRLRGDETIGLTYLDEPFARSGVKGMRVRWEARRRGAAAEAVSTTPRFSARLLPPGTYQLHVTVLKNGSFFDAGWRPIRVGPRSAPAPGPAVSTDPLPVSVEPAEATPEPPPSVREPRAVSRGLLGALTD